MKTALLLYGWLFTVILSTENSPQPRTETARLIIYRQKEFGGKSYGVVVNDKFAGMLPTNRFFQFDLPPGRTKIQSGIGYYTDPQTLFLTLQAGRTYYVKAVEEMDFLSRTLLMAPIGEEQARSELRKVKPAELPSPDPNN